MKYKVHNKTDITIKYMKIIFAPQETKVLTLINPISHENFNIEKIEELEKKPKIERRSN